MSEYVVVLVTASSEKEAETIAEDLVGSRMVACANLIFGIRSIYRWKGEVQKENEVLLVMKGRSDGFSRIEKRVRELHSYDVPEVIALPVLKGSPPYLEWLGEETAE
jgi:periplasmic divalent cation tolerance protein